MYEPGKELLIYGINPEDILECPEFKYMNVYQMADYVRSRGGYVVCAHPFRERDYIPDPFTPPDPAWMDAVEIFNYFNSQEMDETAEAFAEMHGLPGVGGGDIHRTEAFGHSGLAFYERIRSNEDLVQALRAGRYEIIRER